MGVRERYYEYPDARDAVFVLGAGASVSAGVPLQGSLIPSLLHSTDPYLTGSIAGSRILAFIRQFFTWDAQSQVYPSLESVFAFLDFFVQQDISLTARYSSAELGLLREQLIQIIHYLVSKSAADRKDTYERFWRNIARINRNVSVVTLNYDTLLEESFDTIYARYGLIDYRIELMNYALPKGIHPFNWWIDPQRPYPEWQDYDTVPIKVLKLHGSLNWKYCSGCGQVLLTPWDTAIDLNRGGFIDSLTDSSSGTATPRDYLCPFDGTRFQTLIIPPSFHKTLSHPVFTHITGEFLRELRAARRVIFVGYSLPDADVHVKAHVLRAIQPQTPIIVVNPIASPALRSRFAPLAADITFVQDTFESLINDEARIRKLIA